MVVWDVAFADTDYSATCSVEGGTNPSTLELRGYTKATTGLQVTIYNNHATVAETGTLNCWAQHD
jgi:hypothetical protein